MCDKILQNFIDNVDIRHRHIGIFASKWQVRDVWTALHKNLVGNLLRFGIGLAAISRSPVAEIMVQLRLVLEGIWAVVVLFLPVGKKTLPLSRLVIEKLEQIYQVCRGAQDRAAFYTLAEIK